MILALLTSFLSLTSFAETSIENHLVMNSKSGFVSYLSNIPMDQANLNIDTVVIMTHGSDCNAQTYFDTVIIEARALNIQSHVLAIAPHFKTPTDTADTLLPNELSFDDEAWLRGAGSLQDSSVTSFAAVDEMVKRAVNPNLFPAVKTVVITGHSAGGQLTQRYALGSRLEQNYPHIHFRYLAANPGSYTYLNGLRPVLASQSPSPYVPTGLFVVPASASSCDYDGYKYGLSGLNQYPYMSQIPANQMIEEYLARDVTYMLGEADTDPGDGLDQDCPAVVQGPFRFARGLNFKSYLDHLFPYHTHKLVTIPGVIHSERAMFTAPNGAKALFPDAYPAVH